MTSMLTSPPLPIAPADPRPGEVADEIRRAATWLGDVDLDALGDGQLLQLVESLAPVLDRLTITVALALGRAEARDATVDADGLLADAWLRMVTRQTGADRRTLLRAGQVLPTLPNLCQAAEAGEISWSEVRAICLAAGRLSADDRRQLDLQLAADRHALAAMTPSEVLELLDHVLAELHPTDLEARETREFTSQFVAFRPRLDGTGQIFGDLDSVAFGDVAGRVGQLAEQLPQPPDRPDEPRWRSKGHRQALALHRLVAADADDRPGTSAQLLVTIEDPAGTPADRGPTDTSNTIDDTAEGPPRATLHHSRGARAMSPAQLLRLAALAEVRTVVTSGGVPLKVGRSRRRATRTQRNATPPSSSGAAAPGPAATPHRWPASSTTSGGGTTRVVPTTPTSSPSARSITTPSPTMAGRCACIPTAPSRSTAADDGSAEPHRPCAPTAPEPARRRLLRRPPPRPDPQLAAGNRPRRRPRIHDLGMAPCPPGGRVALRAGRHPVIAST